MSDTLRANLSTKIPLSFGTVGARGKFKANMADSSVELIEFFRSYKNEVNLYVTNISRRLEKEVVQVRISLCIMICFAAQIGTKTVHNWTMTIVSFAGQLQIADIWKSTSKSEWVYSVLRFAGLELQLV